MKWLIHLLIGLFLLLSTSACSVNRQSSPYLSIAATYYDDGEGPENGMTISVLKKEADGDLQEVGSVAYSSRYPLATYDRLDHSIYYSAKDEGGNLDQLWRLDLDSQLTTKLTSNLAAINYIIPRATDIVIVGSKRKERRLKPFFYDKKTGVLTEIQTDIDFNCDLCTYNAPNDRLIVVGTSYSQAEDLREKWNKGERERASNAAEDNIYYPADTYIYEIDHKGEAQLILKLDQYEVRKVAIRSADEIVYSGYALKHSDVPKTQFSFKNGHNPEECILFDPDFPLTIYGEFVFLTEQDAYMLGMREEEHPYGIYHYNFSSQELDLVYDGLSPHDSYINNFLLLK